MINAIIDPISVEPVEMALFIEQDRTASIVTTLYDLIAAIQDGVDADDALGVATVQHILGSGSTVWCDNAVPCTS
jgi:hypothetical protein